MVEEIVAALVRASPGDEPVFRANAGAYLKRLDEKIASWENTLKPFAGSKVITFHRSWSYFADWLHLQIAGEVEPKPGIAPGPGHTAEIIQLVRSAGIKAIIVEPFYDLSAPEQIGRSAGAKVLVLPTSVGGAEQTEDYIALMDHNVAALAAALR